MRVLGIESSCDETAAAVIAGSRVLSSVIHSQVALHAKYGGVVPELASRDHLRNAGPVIERALEQAEATLDSIDAIAVTNRPGLSGALLIGTQLASALAWSTDKPLVGVDHLVGHLLAVFLDFPGQHAQPKPEYPFIGLLASGGHTAIYRVDGPSTSQIRELGATRDDAAGEAYDKVAKLLGLGYPGGPTIDRLAQQGDARVISIARPMAQRNSLEFSFSGLKTNIARWVGEHGPLGNSDELRNLCASFQRTVVDTLLSKTFAAARSEGLSTIVLAGGVAANSELRSRGLAEAKRAGLHLIVPPFSACTDNAAMIAFAGLQRAQAGIDERGQLEVSPRTALPRVTRKGGGPRQ